MKKKTATIISIAILVAITVFAIFVGVTMNRENDNEMSYSTLITAIQDREVEKLQAVKDSNTFLVYMKDTEKNSSAKSVTVPNVDEFTSFVAEEILNGSDVKLKIIENSYATLIVSLSTSLLSLAFLIYMMKRLTGGNDKRLKMAYSDVRFSDVAGIDEEKNQLQEVVEFLKNPKKYTDIGAKIPKGILLSGDPGTGKTLLAKAIAGEAGVPFFQVNGSSFEEKFVGVGASRVRKLFDKAKSCAPSIIFIDEIDSVAQSRFSGNNNYSEQTLNQLLSEMDGFESRENVIVIAATNHLEVLDPAIIRPGRFDRKIHIPRPDILGREAILEVHSKNKHLTEDVKLHEIAKKTVGFTGADLENIMNEAAIIAANQSHVVITNNDIDEAIAIVIAGLKKKNVAISSEDRELTAIHESGHAIVSAITRPNVKNFGISVIPRGNAGGYNFFDDNDVVYMRKNDILTKMQVLYGGRLAEEILLGDASSGAVNDLEKASKLARDMVTRYGMDESLLTITDENSTFDKELEKVTIQSAKEICKKQYDVAKIIVESHRDVIRKLADLLIERESLSQEEINQFIIDNDVR